MIQSFRDLVVWQNGMTLTVKVYELLEAMPRTELYGLTSQIKRSVISIPSNIAEGKAIGGRSYRKHLRIAIGSEAELETQLELAVCLKMLPRDKADQILKDTSELGRMLNGLLRKLTLKAWENRKNARTLERN